MRTLIFPIHIIATVTDRHRGNPPVSTFRSGTVRRWWIRRERAHHRVRDSPHFPPDEPHRQDHVRPQDGLGQREVVGEFLICHPAMTDNNEFAHTELTLISHST